ncbi:hypothetical protein [Pelagibius sp. Alg239-R121]|uniref:hypothetical protein n=1 Tax=Pelagibius sp. Alg239-R121 TaxID=2993448 RepID=UPI0024A68C9A|nr:hypothetical protein [Pelagibius sp. Alg239-R121]
MTIVMGNYDEMPVLKEDVKIVVEWVSTALATLRAHSQNPIGLGAGQANATLWTSDTGKHSGKLRVDRQRVIGVNQRTTSAKFYTMKPPGKLKRKGATSVGTTDPSEKVRLEGLGYKTGSETKKDVQVADYVWTLFATQVNDTHNQLFVLNNFNVLNTIGQAQLTTIWHECLKCGGGAVLTNDGARVPDGFTASKVLADTDDIEFW